LESEELATDDGGPDHDGGSDYDYSAPGYDGGPNRDDCGTDRDDGGPNHDDYSAPGYDGGSDHVDHDDHDDHDDYDGGSDYDHSAPGYNGGSDHDDHNHDSRTDHDLVGYCWAGYLVCGHFADHSFSRGQRHGHLVDF
jgi:hypothetical protein